MQQFKNNNILSETPCSGETLLWPYAHQAASVIEPFPTSLVCLSGNQWVGRHYCVYVGTEPAALPV